MAGQTLALGYESALEPAANVLTLAGTQSVSVDGFVGFPASALTVSFWIRTAETSANAVLFAYDANGVDTSHQIVLKNPGNLAVLVGEGSTGATSAAVNDNAWHQVAVVLAPYGTQNLAVTLYVDGVPVFVSVGVLAATPFESSGDLVLGRSAVDGASPSLAGQYSEFRLWSGARTQAQIVNDMQIRASGLAVQPLTYWALTSAETSGTLNGAPVFQSSTLRFRTQDFSVSWTAVDNATSYSLLIEEQSGCWQPMITGVTGLSTPISTYSLHALYTAQVQAVVNANPGPWSDVRQATPINLPPITATLSGNTVDATLKAEWTTIDQALAYRFVEYRDGAITPTSATSVTAQEQDLTSLLEDADHWWTYAIRGDTTGGSVGPPSSITPVTAPDLRFWFENDALNLGTLGGNWDPVPNADYVYLAIDQTNATPPDVFAAVLSAADAPIIQVTPAPADGAELSARLRAVAPGSIGQWSTAIEVTVQRFPPPLITSSISDAADHTITVSWSIDSQIEGLRFDAQLYDATGDTQLEHATTSDPSYTFNNPAIVDDTHFKVRVRAKITRSYSMWSTWEDIAVDGLPTVPLNAPTVDAQYNITVTWIRPDDMPDGAKYNVSINSPTPQAEVLDASATTVTFAQSDTKVVANKTYTISMYVSEPSQQDGITTTAKVETKPTPDVPVDNPNSPGEGDPVNTTEGAYVYSQKLLSLHNPVPLEFGVSYSSTRPTRAENPDFPEGPLGARWTHIYETALLTDTKTGKLWVLWGDGSVDRYAIPASIIGNYPKQGIQSGDALTFGEDQIYRLRRKNQMLFLFDRNGVMTRFEMPNGNGVTLSYDSGSGQLDTVADTASGKSFTFAYDGSNRLDTVTDNAGRRVSFGYSGGNLTSITNAGGGSRTLAYTGASLLETVTSETGNVILKNTYTTVLGTERVTFQQDGRALALGETYGSSFAYSRTTQDDVDYIICDYSDREGIATRYTSVEANGNAVEVRLDLPNDELLQSTNNYDGNGDLLAQRVYRGAAADIDPDKYNLSQYTYDGNKNLLTATNPLGQTTTTTYDGQNRPVTVTDSLGNVMTYHYAGAELEWIEDFVGGRTRFTYETGEIKGLPKTVIDRFGNVTTFTHDPAGLVETVTAPTGEVARISYFETGFVAKIVTEDKDGNAMLTRAFTYWGDGSTKTATTSYPGQAAGDAYVSSYEYYADGTVKSFTNALGDVFNYAYDPNALLETANYPDFDGISRQTAFTYDRNDFPRTQTASPTLQIGTATRYNQIGEMLSLTDPKKFVYGYSYQPDWINDQLFNSRVIETLPVLDGQTGPAYTNIWDYDPAGRLVASRNAQDQETLITYSSRVDSGVHLMVATATLPPANTGDDPYTREFVYDPLDRLVSHTNEDGKTTKYTYGVEENAQDGLFYSTVTITDPEQRTMVVTLNPNGALARTVRGSGADAIEQSYRYDALGRLIEVSETRSAGEPVITRYSYTYVASENAIKVEVTRNADPTVLSTQYLNPLGQVIKEVDAVGAARTFAFSPWGMMSGYTDAGGKSLAYKFDSAGRFHQTNLPDGTSVERVLDANGNVTALSNGSGQEITRSYDNWNRLLSRTSAAGETVGYDYTPMSLLKTLTYPDLKTVSYTYDGLNRMLTVTDWAARVTHYGYNPVGQVTSTTLPNGVVTIHAYDNAGQLTSIETTQGANIIAQLGYTVNSAGLRTTAVSVLPLPPVIPTDPVTLEYNAANQATTFDGSDLERTANGSLITLPNAGLSVDLGYDDLNRVTTVGTDTYGYDLEGHRVETSLAGVTRKYAIDPGTYSDPRINYPLFQPLQQTGRYDDAQGGSGMLPDVAMPGPAYPALVNRPLDRVLEIRDAQDDIVQRLVYGLGLLSLELADGAYRAFHFDSRGSTLALSDDEGYLSDRYAYDVYGALSAANGQTSNPFLYNGRDGVMDDRNGLLYMRSRHFAPGLFNFAQRDMLFGDPFGPQSLNRYSYVQNNPISLVDPLGFTGSHDVWAWVLGGVGVGLIGLAAGLAIYGAVNGGGGAAASTSSISMVPLLGGGPPPSTIPPPSPTPSTLGPGQSMTMSNGSILSHRGGIGGSSRGGGTSIEMRTLNSSAVLGSSSVGGGVVVGGGGVGGGTIVAGGSGVAGGAGGIGLGAGLAVVAPGAAAIAGILGIAAIGGAIALATGGGGAGALAQGGGGTDGNREGTGNSSGTTTGSLKTRGLTESDQVGLTDAGSTIPPMQQVPVRPWSGNTNTLRYRGRSSLGGSDPAT